MTYLENKTFISIKRPFNYLKYVDDKLILANDINEINILQDTFQKSQFLTLIMNKEKIKFSFLDVLIYAKKMIIASLPLLTNKNTNNNSCTLNFKSECPFRLKKNNY